MNTRKSTLTDQDHALMDVFLGHVLCRRACPRDGGPGPWQHFRGQRRAAGLRTAEGLSEMGRSNSNSPPTKAKRRV